MHCYLYLKFQGMIFPWEDINLRLKYIIKNNESFITKKKTFPFCVAILKLNVAQTVVQKIIGLFCTMQDVKLWQQNTLIINKKKVFLMFYAYKQFYGVCCWNCPNYIVFNCLNYSISAIFCTLFYQLLFSLHSFQWHMVGHWFFVWLSCLKKVN